jgi:LysM repeat protein
MTQRYISTVLLSVLLIVAVATLAGCERPKSTGPTVVPPRAAGTGTVPAATGMPTPPGPKAVATVTGAAPTLPTATTPAVPGPTPTTKPIPISTYTPLPTAPAGGQAFYVVKPGDWLWKIAREKGVSPQAIAAANPGVDVNMLQPGQTLIIPATSGTTLPVTPAPGTGQTTHVVKSGENLFRIALKYNKTPQAIATANGITNPNMIYVGQVLVIP